MLNPQALADAVVTATNTMLNYNDARALDGVADADWVKAHFTHRGDVQQRAALHQQIISGAFEKAVAAPEGGKPEAIVVCGPFAVGKDHLLGEMLAGKSYESGAMNALAQTVRAVHAHSVHSDMDAIRKQIPEYNAAVDAGNPDASAIVRAEVSGLSVAISNTAKTHGYPLVQVESYADPSAVEHIRELSKTHHVTLVGVTSTPQEVHKQNEARAKVTGRTIPRTQIDDSIRKFAAVFPKLKDVAAEVFLVDGQSSSLMYHAQAGEVDTKSFSPDDYVAFTKLAGHGVAPSPAAEQGSAVPPR